MLQIPHRYLQLSARWSLSSKRYVYDCFASSLSSAMTHRVEQTHQVRSGFSNYARFSDIIFLSGHMAPWPAGVWRRSTSKPINNACWHVVLYVNSVLLTACLWYWHTKQTDAWALARSSINEYTILIARVGVVGDDLTNVRHGSKIFHHLLNIHND